MEHSEISIVVDEVYNPSETDFRSMVTKVKAANPDLVYVIPQTPAAGVNFLKQYKSQGGTAKLLTAEVLAGRDVVTANAKDMEGLTAIEPAVDDTQATSKAYFGMYKARYGDPSFPAFESMTWDIVHLLRDGVMAVGYDGEALKNWLYTIKDRVGASGKITLDANGDSQIASYRVSQVKDGVQTTVEYIAGSAN